MIISAFSPASIWANSARTLTGFGSSALGFPSSGHVSLANGAQVDLRPPAGIFRELLVIGEALLNVTWTPGLFDGTTFRAGVPGASGAAVTVTLIGSAAFGPALQNTGTVSGFYNTSGGDWHQ